MRSIGNLDRYPELRVIVEAIFNRTPEFVLPNGTKLKTTHFGAKNLFAVDYKGCRYVEQNPNSHSVYAQRALEGSKIVWAIKTHNKVKDASGKEYLVPCSGIYMGLIQDGEVWMK